MIKIILTLTISTVLTAFTYGQTWPKIYSDNYGVHVRSLLEDYDKGYILGGFIDKGSIPSQWAWIIKTNLNGEVLWKKQLGDLSYLTYINEIQKNSDNSKIIAGASSNYDLTGNFDPLFIKLNKCGEVEWCTVLQSPDYNSATGVIPLNEGGYVGMLKYYGGNYQNVRISLVKMDSSGTPLWIRHLAQEDTTISNEEGYDLTLSFDSNYLVTGHCYSQGLKPYWIMIDTAGEQLWNIKWNLPGSGPGSVIQTIKNQTNCFYSSGGLIGPGRPMTPVLFKFDEAGNQLYHVYLLGDTIDGGGAESICYYNDTTLIIGLNWSDNPNPDDGMSEIIMTDTIGNTLKRRLLIDENRSPENIIKTFDNKILVSGNYVVDVNWDIYLWKLNSDLENDTLYTQAFTYDSLCPYPIPSDTIDLSCGVYVSIDEIPLKEDYDKALRIYPNPAASTINFEFKDLKTDAVLSIYDGYCKLRDEIVIPAYTKKIQTDITAYPAGLYLAVLRNSHQILAKEKLIIE
ncbi:MAG: hypothetical protein NT175_08510 [Bacteroidetes bacterium]|nr:hypothetical protein [Bacteroidota bacterium]